MDFWWSWAGGVTMARGRGPRLVIVPGKEHFIWPVSTWHSGTLMLGVISSKNISNSNNS